ncbi:hypothetical protein DMB95_07015 [Campylobacter sp. MIT 12-8780]|uniref:hypothetical protein n=1 Tax=unclassified Campylobacter TaxID=2593542 RepID=UPI00115DF5CC|nr:MULTISPECIES: hypothetical protein [unclassified Campylobacter]NDJ27714.1 hypothetical protein [Campylobacter sp. MIT 19-121]TQR40876.1 hypothetical protein DMB95_07015 [Campylobacter sp. MIT 12-8780]
MSAVKSNESYTQKESNNSSENSLLEYRGDFINLIDELLDKDDEELKNLSLIYTKEKLEQMKDKELESLKLMTKNKSRGIK